MPVERLWRRHDLKPAYDVVIIGAGVHGLAIAYYLGRRGVTKVAVLDKTESGILLVICKNNHQCPLLSRLSRL
jgi:thioredoxin reductase